MAIRATEREARPRRKRTAVPDLELVGRTRPEGATAALRMAERMGLLDGPKAKHLNAKVPPKLFQAAAGKLGTTSPAAVVSAALAVLATEDELGPWLARRWGALADVDPALLEQIEI